MSSRSRRKNQVKRAFLLVAVVVVVGLIITAAALIVNKVSKTAIKDPAAVIINVAIDGEKVAVKPYRVCDLFINGEDSCKIYEENAAEVTLADDQTADIEVGNTVGSNSWAVQRFYADETVNSTSQHPAGETEKETVAGSASVNGQRTPLGVAEVSTALVGENAAGEETTYGITWSIVNKAAEKK